MDEQRQRLLDQIDSAFAGVELGDGVSMHESVVIDDYGTCEQRVAARTPDEKLDWRKLIDDPELIWLFSPLNAGLCFLDATGLRFYLPACLSLGVRYPEGGEEVGDMLVSLEFCLKDLSAHSLERLAILNDAQRSCVRDVLTYFRDSRDWEDQELDQAIAGYWSRDAVTRQPATGEPRA